MFGLSVIKTSSLNKLRADITKLRLDKEALTSDVNIWKSRNAVTQRNIEKLNRELAIYRPVKDPKSGKFTKKNIHSEKSRID